MTEQSTCILNRIKAFNGYMFNADTETLFDAANYSMFKYGAGTVARQYGYDLFAKFLVQQLLWWGIYTPVSQENVVDTSWVMLPSSNEEGPNKSDSNNSKHKIYVTCSPYKVAPPAAHAVTHYFMEALNKYLTSINHPKAIFFQVERLRLFEGDFGILSESQRRGVMADVQLATPDDVDLRDSNVVVIDDIRITGAHEQAVLGALLGKQPKRICKAYVALFDKEEGLEKLSKLEARLNNAIVKNINDLDNLMKAMRDNYIPNSRVCKFILSQQDIPALKRFLRRQSPHMLQRLYDYMEADGYSDMKSYRPQMELVKEALSINKTQSSQKLVGLGLSMLGGAIFCKIESSG